MCIIRIYIVLFFCTTDNSQQIHAALLSLPKLLPRVEKALLTGRSDLVQASNRNVQPVDSQVQDIVAAVPAAVPSSEPSDLGLPTAAGNNSDVVINKPLVVTTKADKVAVAKEDVDDNNSATPPDSLVPQEWLRFRYHIFTYCSYSVLLSLIILSFPF